MSVTPVVGTVTLDELAARANAEHELVVKAGEAMIEHAIRAGEALLEAQAQLPWGQWEPWLDEHFNQSRVNAAIYMRIARYRDFVIESGITSIRSARRLLSEHCDSEAQEPPRHPQHLRLEVEACRLHKSGMPKKHIAELLDVRPEQVTYWTNPAAYRKRIEGNRRRKRRAQEARRALERQRRDAAVKKIGGSAAEMYSLIRKALQEGETAEAQVEGRDHRLAMREAISALHKAEDEIVIALGIAHGKDRRSLASGRPHREAA